MEHFSTFLQKFKKVDVPNKEVRERCATYCAKVLKRPVSSSAIRVSGKIIYLDLPPLLKGEVLLHKKDLLVVANNAFPEVRYMDVR